MSMPTDDCATITFDPAANRPESLLAACKVRVNYSVYLFIIYISFIYYIYFFRSIFLR
jgi:hypothetical protein